MQALHFQIPAPMKPSASGAPSPQISVRTWTLRGQTPHLRVRMRSEASSPFGLLRQRVRLGWLRDLDIKSQKFFSSSPLEFGLRRWLSLLFDAVLLHETGASRWTSNIVPVTVSPSSTCLSDEQNNFEDVPFCAGAVETVMTQSSIFVPQRATSTSSHSVLKKFPSVCQDVHPRMLAMRSPG